LAAIDIASEVHYVSVPEDRDERHVRTFHCLTPGLQEMADWLRQCRIERVVMEATGVYFVPVFEFLQDSGFTVRLVRGGAARDIAGKKTDVADAVWLRTVYSCGLIHDCFVPDKELSVLRWYWRLRADQVQGCAEHTLRMHKALELMNVQLHKVLSDVTGVSGMAIIRAIIAGERDPILETDLRDSRGEQGIARRHSAERDEARSGLRLEPGSDTRPRPPIRFLGSRRS